MSSVIVASACWHCARWARAGCKQESVAGGPRGNPQVSKPIRAVLTAFNACSQLRVL